jgi:hypothetical protein
VPSPSLRFLAGPSPVRRHASPRRLHCAPLLIVAELRAHLIDLLHQRQPPQRSLPHALGRSGRVPPLGSGPSTLPEASRGHQLSAAPSRSARHGRYSTRLPPPHVHQLSGIEPVWDKNGPETVLDKKGPLRIPGRSIPGRYWEKIVWADR